MLKDSQRINVVLPALPSEWKSFRNDISAELVYHSDGRMETVSGLEFGELIKIEAEKAVVPFAAYPVLQKQGIRLKPAGGVFPENYNGRELELSWKNGFASEILLTLREKGTDFSYFNIGRFENVLVEKSGGNPWRISETAVLYSLSEGIFNSNHISVKQSLNIELSDEFFSGEWVFADPPDSRGLLSVLGVLILDNIYSGHHFLIRSEENKLKYAEIFIDNEKWTVFFSGGEGGLSGQL